MAKIYSSIAELVGRTPLLELKNYEEKHDLKAKIFVKLEYFNPNQSVKDRIALAMVEEAEKSGELKKGRYDYRTYKRKYRYRTCGNRSGKGL